MLETSYIDLEEKERKEKEEGLKTTHIRNVNEDEYPSNRDQRQKERKFVQSAKDAGASRQEGKELYKRYVSPEGRASQDLIANPLEPRTVTQIPVEERQLPQTLDEKGQPVIAKTPNQSEPVNYYEKYIGMLDESLVDPVNTKARQDRLAKTAQINATGEMLQNAIDLIAGGGSGGAPIFKRTDTATPAMLNQLERLRLQDDRSQEIHNAQKLQNQIRAISFGQQAENQDRVSRQIYEGQHYRTEERIAGEKFRAGENKLGREAAKEARKETRQFSKDEWEAKYAQALKDNIALDDHRTKNTIAAMKERYGYDAAILGMKAAAAAKSGSGDNPNFYVIDKETGQRITIPPEQYWYIFQEVITKQNTLDGVDDTYNDSFDLSETEINSLVAKHWKDHYVKPAQPPTTERTNKVSADQADVVLKNIMADPELSLEDMRGTYKKYLEENTALTDDEIAEIVNAIR